MMAGQAASAKHHIVQMILSVQSSFSRFEGGHRKIANLDAGTTVAGFIVLLSQVLCSQGH